MNRYLFATLILVAIHYSLSGIFLPCSPLALAGSPNE